MGIATGTAVSALGDDQTLRAAPIVAAVDDSAAGRAAAADAVVLADELRVPLVFVYVRRGPAGYLGAPFHERGLIKEMNRARRVLDRSLQIANLAEVEAEAEILEGSPQRRIVEFARDRGAQLIVVGSRRRRLRHSVSRAVARAADRPVVIAASRPSSLPGLESTASAVGTSA
jgi:nucleotide-binding universal stress UspA family protein